MRKKLEKFTDIARANKKLAQILNYALLFII